MIPKDNISLAKKLLNRLIKKIKPKEKYDEVIQKIANQTKKEIINTYSCSKNGIFAVFGKDGFFVFKEKKEQGKKLLARISRKICKKYKAIVITGNRLYYYTRGKVKSQKNIINLIINVAKENKPVWRANFSKILGYIPDKAVFLIDKERSASQHEEASFHNEEKSRGLAVIIFSRKFQPCKYSVQRRLGRLVYNMCNTSEYENCTRKKSKCFTKKLKINPTTMEPFITKKTHSVIFVENINDIEDIIINHL